MAHEPEKRAIVRACYVHQRQPLEVASDKAEVSMRTAGRWKAEAKADGDDWDAARAAKHLASEGTKAVALSVLEDFINQLQSTMSSLRDSKDLPPLDKAKALATLADAYAKMLAALGRTLPEISRLAIAMDVIRILREVAQRDQPEHLDALAAILDASGPDLAKAFG